MTNFNVHEDIREASTLPSAFYKDPAVFELVRERIFARSWQFVGDTDSVKVAGTVHPFVMLEGFLNEPMVFTREMNDTLHLLSNVCTHRGMQVVEGNSNLRHLRCRYHGRRFGLDGCLQSMPEFEGVCRFPTELDDLPRVPFGSLSKLLFASIDPEIDLEVLLAPVKERLGWLPLDQFFFEPSRSRDYIVRANWALYVDNYLEGFHIPFVHASLNETLDYGSYASELHSHGNLQLGVSAGGDSVFDLPRTCPDVGKNISAYYYWLFPNTMLNFYPWGLSINVVRPLAPDLTKVSFLCYVWDETKIESGAGAGLDRVEREDEVVVELVQRGVRSRFYDRGRFSPTREQNVHHFHRLLSARLGT